MGIKQLNGTYVGPEDRILLRLTTDAREEVRLWLTRSVTAQLLVSIQAIAARDIAQKYPPQVAQTVAEFEHQSLRARTRLDDEFQSGATFPLGESPALVVRLAAIEKGEELALELVVANGNKVNLSLPRQLARQFAILLERTQESAKWGLTSAPATLPSQNKVMH